MTFEDVISQPHITRTLTNQLKAAQTAHAYLFTGSRGTGKTTCAKILAKAVNCTDLKDGNPCLKCSNCLSVENGTPDIVEIDAASNNGVDDVRALRDEIVYSPVNCKYRVYIIDEVHMLSVSAFNALLKTIEEPPPHVKFILATTESHKVPATIVSRCQRFEFNRINTAESAERLLKIAVLENIPLDADAAALISRLSDGGMRDALTMLDTCASIAPEAVSETAVPARITVHTVSECAGVAGKEHLFGISEAVLNQDCETALMILNSLYARSKDIGRLIDELIFHYRNLMLLKTISLKSDNNIPDIFTILPQDWNDYNVLCGKMTLEHIMRVLGILEKCFEKSGRSGNRRLSAEMCFIELCSPRLDSGEKALSARIADLERMLEQVSVQKPFPETMKAVTEKPPAPKPVSEADSFEEHISAEENHVSSEVKYTSAEEEYYKLPQPQYMDEPENSPSAPDIVFLENKFSKKTEYRNWGDVLNLLPPFLAGMLDDARVFLENNVLLIYGNEIMGGLIANPDNNALLSAAIRRVSGNVEHGCSFKFIENKPEEKSKSEDSSDRIKEFLDMLNAEGVEIKKRKKGII